MGNTSSNAGYAPAYYPPPGGYLVGEHQGPQVPYMGYPQSGYQPPYGPPNPPAAYAAPGAPQFPPNAVFEGQKPNKLKALWSKYTDQAPVVQVQESEQQPASPPAAPAPPPPPQPEKPASLPEGQLPPVIARDTEHAKVLDAADGKPNGKYFGAPIHIAPRKLVVPQSPSSAPVEVEPERVQYGKDRYGYDFPLLEEVVELSDHGRPLEGPVTRAAANYDEHDQDYERDNERDYERDYDRSYDRAYDRVRYNDEDWEYGYGGQDYGQEARGYYPDAHNQAYYRPRPAGVDQYELGYYGRRY